MTNPVQLKSAAEMASEWHKDVTPEGNISIMPRYTAAFNQGRASCARELESWARDVLPAILAAERVEELNLACISECEYCAAASKEDSRWSKATSTGKHFTKDGFEAYCRVPFLRTRIAELEQKLLGSKA